MMYGNTCDHFGPFIYLAEFDGISGEQRKKYKNESKIKLDVKITKFKRHMVHRVDGFSNERRRTSIIAITFTIY